MRLYIVRHGETHLNKEFRFIGRTDPALSQTGELQAMEVAARLANAGIQAVYASDLLRTVQTATIIAERVGLTVEPVPGLREIDFGEWEGLSYDEIVERDGELLEAWLRDPMHIDVPGGEPWRHFELRISSALDAIINNGAKDSIVIVTHGGPIKLLMTRFHGGDPLFFNSFWPQAGGLNIVDLDGDRVEVVEMSGVRYVEGADMEGV